jgi:hypothetical protein
MTTNRPQGPAAPTIGPIPALGSVAAQRWVVDRVRSLVNCAVSLVNQIPGARTAAPPNPQDGWTFLARDPWRPVAGQTVDAWVYYDAAGGVWRLQGTTPTNT